MTLRKASQLLLKHLKTHRKGVIALFRSEIKEEEYQLKGQIGFEESMS